MHHYSTPYRAILCFTLSVLAGGMAGAQSAQITGFSATAYDHHVELKWDQPQDPAVTSIRVFGAAGTADFTELGTGSLTQEGYIDFVGDFDVTTRYFLRARNSNGQLGAPTDTLTATTFEMSDSMLLDMVQEYTLRYFYDFGHPVSGLARERNAGAIVTSGGSGFGLMALIVGAERGFITREQALERTNKMVDFLLTVPKFKGAFSHWMNGATGAVIPFSPLDDGGDLVETAFLIQGLLTSRQYFGGDDDTETRLRDNINILWQGVDWNWYRKQSEDVLYWHWSPTNQFAINLPLRGFNEVQIAYILGVAAPVAERRIPASVYTTGWAGDNYTTNNSFYDIPLLVGRDKGGPLFFSHYSFMGFDPRGKRDAYTNYFVRNRNQTLINYRHCIDNPYNYEGYSAESWGLTASDDPDGYKAHAPDNRQTDNGTITPTAALGSMPYTPVESMAALKHFYRELGDSMWGPYGFYDAFNEERDWYATSYLAIDQGPIICMIENARSGLLWDLFMSSPEIQPALDAIGFVEDSVTSLRRLPEYLLEAPTLFPNPALNSTTLSINLRGPMALTVDLVDGQGRLVTRIFSGAYHDAGTSQIPLHLRPRPTNGVYYVRITAGGQQYTLPLSLTR